MVTEKTTFLQMPNTFLQIIISKCKNDKPWKNEIAKVPAPSVSPKWIEAMC